MHKPTQKEFVMFWVAYASPAFLCGVGIGTIAVSLAGLISSLTHYYFLSD